METIVIGIICLLAAVAALIISVFQFKQKGFLLNNAYLYASKEERESMNKKPYYIQTGIVFVLLGLVFICEALTAFTKTVWITYCAIAIAVIAIIFAIVSSVIISKRNK